ncbi:MAG: TrbI/VirB10 family protein [Lentisphaeria bacterium]|nr:TrbI/VirB10 family protein [Lentisphaeria bacterium]NQZ66719.1 TrbI/VirB10 family protein [Lentisphaeria bacterium]
MLAAIFKFLKGPIGKISLFVAGFVFIIFLIKTQYTKAQDKEPTAKHVDSSETLNKDKVEIDHNYTDLDLNPIKHKSSGTIDVPKVPAAKSGNARSPEEIDQRIHKELTVKVEEEKALTDLMTKHNKANAVKAFYLSSPLALYPTQNLKDKKEKELSSIYAPYGRFIKCMVINTVDSANLQTPVVGLVLEDVWHDGNIIIPAGTEVHGRAKRSALRDRIATDNAWVVVWRTRDKDNGKELNLSAIALDHNPSGAGETDGSAGLRGMVIRTDNYKELKLYAALFVKGAAAGLSKVVIEAMRSATTSTNVNSTVIDQEPDTEAQAKVAGAEAMNEVVSLYASRMLAEIEKNGSFVRVSKGTSFYLYVQQTIDKQDARPGATGQKQLQESSGKELSSIEKESNAINAQINLIKQEAELK